jgi:uncharacterized glyoxalase superfamily protein PhnB
VIGLISLQNWAMIRGHSYDPAEGFPQIMPSLRYEDVNAALAWLTRVFGLEEHLRWTAPDGVVRHAEMNIGAGFVELSTATTDQPSPRTLHATSSSLIVFVDDVAGHYKHARSAGAVIVSVLEDKPWGLRQYTAKDLEGHHWEFSQQMRRVPPSEWGAELAR